MLRHHSLVHGHRTCYHRTFCVGGVTQSPRDAYRQCRERPVAAIRHGEAWFGRRFGHRLGVGLYEAPMISRRS
jgi:hypothetical protein